MPIFTSPRGVEITAESEEAVAAVYQFELDLLSLAKGSDKAPAYAEEFPETAMVQACAATYYIYGQDVGSLAKADPYLMQAESLAGGTSDREQKYIKALRLFHGMRYIEALSILEQLTEQYPRDLLSAKVAEFLYYCLGQHHSGPRFLDHMTRLEKQNNESAGYWAMRSFATELCGDYNSAQDEAERSLSIDERQPWAHHTLAHVTSRRGRSQHGIEYMEQMLPMWRESNRGIHSHNAWHLGLLYLDQMDLGKVHALIERDLWGITPNTVFEQIDTIALLWRLDQTGNPAPDKLWAAVAHQAEQHAGQCLMPFLEGHFVYALARAGNSSSAKGFVRKAQIRAEQDDPEARQIWAPIGADFVAACAEFGAGRHREAVSRLMPLARLIPMVGGSDAQDDLFRTALIHGLKTNRDKADAESLWNLYYGDKWRTAFDDALLA